MEVVKAGVAQQTTQVVGEGKFASNGDIKLPVKKGDKVTLMPKSKILAELNKIANEELRGAKKEKKVIPKVDPKFERANVVEMNQFIKDIKKSLGVEIEEVKVNNVSQPIEHIVVHDSVRIAWISPRQGALFGLYLFSANGSKDIRRVHDSKEIASAVEWMKHRIHEIDTTPKTQPKSKVTKTSKINTPVDSKVITSKLIEMMAKCDSGNAISVPHGILGNEKWFQKLCKDESWHVDIENRTISRVSQ